MCFYHSGTKQAIQSATVLFTIIFMLFGCAPTKTSAPVDDRASSTQIMIDSSPIDEMIAGLEPAAAIALLDNTAANNNPNRAFAFMVKAVEIAIHHESGQSVDQRLQTLYQRYPGKDKTIQLAILNNRILLARRKARQVIESIDSLQQQATPTEKLSLQSLKAEALLQAGFPIESVQLRIALDRDYQTVDPGKQPENDTQLWHSLMQVQPDLISGHISEIPDTFSGWLELAHIAQRYQFDSVSLNTEIDKWIARNPDHPANRQIIEVIRKKQIATSKHPEHIALILPLSGKLASVGTAIRDGFMSAYLESSRIFGTQIVIDIYDTEADSERASQAVKLANDRGAQFIVGPLNKEAVSAAIAANQAKEATPTNTGKAQKLPAGIPLAAPANASMLTLNSAANNLQTDIMTDPADAPVQNRNSTIYQFDLAPETEALQVAERASLEGLNYAMVMVPENIWGNRIYEAFTQRYQELGGEIVALQRFQKESADYSTNIQQGLKLNLSKIRHKQLESLLHKNLGFTPRRRKDIDMIFIAASPQQARLIKPQLKFFYAEDIPVYATSSVYTGDPNPGRDKDLENIIFCDMPWLLTSKPAPGSLQRSITTAWPQKAAKYLRFHALGADAFLLLPQLEWLKENNNDQIAGGTGRLSLDKSGVVQRQLSWASFKHSVPEIQHLF